MKVFSYGSNMLLERIQAPTRCPHAKKHANGSVAGRILRFHKRSVDRSGKCDMRDTGNARDVVWGAVFDVPDNEMPPLRDAEGVGAGYHEASVDVQLSDGSIIKAKAFVADDTHIDGKLRPYTWYKRLVLAGANQNGLPGDYIARIEAILDKRDRDTRRQTKREAEAILKTHWQSRPRRP